jgi:nucleoporin NUP159
MGVSSPGKGSPSSESMDSDESEPEEPANKEPFSIFGKPSNQAPSMFSPLSSENTKSTKVETSKSKFSFSNNNSSTAMSSSTQNQVTSPLSALSDKTATPRREQSVSTPTFDSSFDAPLPPDPMSRASYAAGDTSASSNVSKSSVEDAPLPPDFTTWKKPSSQEDAPLPPDFLNQKKSSPKLDDAPLPPDFITKKPAPAADDAPLPPDFLSKPKKAESPLAAPEEAPLPPDFLTKVKTEPIEDEEAVPIPDGSDADSEGDESDFSDSGEEITHDETKVPSPEASAESSFGGISEKSATGGLFSGFSKAAAPKEGQQAPRKLFGEIPKQPLLPPPGPIAQSNREPYRSPSPTRLNSQRNTMFSKKPEQHKEAGSALATRKASLTRIAQRDGQLRKHSNTSQDEKIRARQAVQRQEEEEALSLSDDDEDERLRADLARPVEPVATLDPFLPHQNYTGETAKPGIPGMIERLYRDINSMVDTLGINARSLDSYLLYQQPSQSSQVAAWVEILKSEQPSDILDEKAFLQNITNLDDVVAALRTSLNDQRVQGVEEKLAQCHELLTKDIVSLRSLFASIRKILDAHTDTGSIIAAPLSAEQATLQQDLRTNFTEIQAKMAGLEEGVSLLRAKIADIPRTDGTSASNRKRPTVEAVASTIATMMSMAEGKSSDIDVLEAQMRKLGVDVSTVSSSREGSPFTTPRKNAGRFPATPGSRGSVDGSSYHTPESASRGVNFRASMNGSAKHSRLRSVEGVGQIAVQEETSRWKSKNSRRQHLVGNLKAAIEKKDVKLRTLDEDWVVVDKK